MKSPRPIPDIVRQVQIETSDPTASAWVAANAGAGKTHVLAQRVIRLLLRGVDPAKILCITFTKAAAANMANRVFDTLGAWVELDDVALAREIVAIGDPLPSPRRLALARRLFAGALETPGGLKVQTIHAFCTRLLQQFPFEANVAARFTVLDERAESELLDRATLDVLLEAAAKPESALGQALASAIAAAADTTFRDLVREAIGRRDALARWVAAAGGIPAAIDELSRALGLDPADTLARIEAAIVGGPILPVAAWGKAAEICRAGSANDQKQCQRLAQAAEATGAVQVEAYLSVFFTEKGPRKTLVTSALAQKEPALAQKLADEQLRLTRLIERRRAVMIRDRSAALLTVVHEVIGRYAREKVRKGLLDYDDLIEKTLELFDNVSAAWVLYKLDLGIDHLLVDEAQDTSPKQWEIVKRLVAEFTAGEGARAPRTRTIFAVGDEKQSIFSFQGAEPGTFAQMRRHFKHAHETSGLTFVAQEFKHSFRSGPNVLGAVDEVFRPSEIAASVTTDADGVPPHIALPDALPGRVEIWPLVAANERREVEAWDAPFDLQSETSPQARLAQRIARTIAAWQRQGRRPGDILVLVRQRGALFEGIIRALKYAGIPVGGADRLVLTEHIAVVDLMALADCLLLREDDLSLAIVLKSPLFGFDDEDLFRIAWGRPGTLRDALRAHAGEDARFSEASSRLDQLAEAARCDTPFAFYARLLGPGGGRRRIFARLGTEAADALDEFLNLALDYETRETPSLQGFVAWLRAAPTEVKRDLEIARDEVRVMTVHGAKGLEAPIVILADTTTPPAGPRPPRLLALPAGSGRPDLVVWAGRKDDDVPAVAAARTQALNAARDEYRRLLYVAMTRAAERLVVCGYEGERKRPDGCWYDLVHTALRPRLTVEPADDGDGEVGRWRTMAERAVAAEPAAGPAEQSPERPEWLSQAAPAETRPIVLSPSTAFDESHAGTPAGAASAETRQVALLRGRLLHRLMQSLPDIPPDGRVQAGMRYLGRAGAQFSEDWRAALLAQVRAVLDAPQFAALFAPGSRSEVPIVGRLARRDGLPVLVSGRVDRLAAGADAVLIADYKTNRVPPRRLEDVPEAYVAQLALYRAVLTKLYPDRPIRAALVWTDGPDLMELPADGLDRALEKVLAGP